MSQLDGSQADVVAPELPEQDEGTAAATVAPEVQDEKDPGIEGFYKDDEPQEGEGEQGEEEELDPDVNDDLPPIAAPNSWKAEEKELFAELPRKHQEIVARRESERDKFVQQKAQEAGQAQVRAQQEAQQHVAQLHAQKAQEYQQLAASVLPEPPNDQLLWMGDTPEEQQYYQRVHQQQTALYQHGLAQQQMLQQRASEERTEAENVARAQAQWGRIIDRKELHERRPDWFDENGPTHQFNDGTAVPLKLKDEVVSRLLPIGEALGYPRDLIESADANDCLALETAADWKAKADKYDELQKRKMEGVRAAKALPRIAKPGAAAVVRKATDDPLKLLYPND